MAAHVDWNEVYYRSTPGDTSARLAAAGAKHIAIYVDPNITPYCPVPAGYGPDSAFFPENGENCAGQVAQFLQASDGSYARSFQHSSSGGRLVNRADGFYGGMAQEPLDIADASVWYAFRRATQQNAYATDVFEDDSGGYYDESYWRYKYGSTAVEFDSTPYPQVAYERAAAMLSSAAARPVIGNDGASSDPYDLAWATSQNVEGTMSEHAWEQRSDTQAWVREADDVMIYHAHRRYVVEEDTDAARLFFQVASHWIVYDQRYSIEFLAEVDPAERNAGVADTTFPVELVVPSRPRIATPVNEDVTVFEVAPGLFAREYRRCYEDGSPIGACAAIVNTTGDAQPLPHLAGSYSRVLVPNRQATWAAGGEPAWSPYIPSEILANDGLILAQ